MQRWNTTDRPASEQYAYWREVVCEAFTPLRPTARDSRDSWREAGLEGWVDSHAFGAVNGAEIGTCVQTMRHGDEEVARVSDGVVFINLMLRGRCLVSQGSQETMSGPGTFSIVDATRPFRLDYIDPWRTISFRVPSARIPGGITDDMIARPFSAGRGIGAVLADTMRSAWARAAELTDTQATTAGTAIAALVGVLAEAKPSDDFTGEPARDEALRSSIEHFVVRHLQYGDTSPGAIAHHFAISVRKLHQIYESAPLTFSQTVMHLRVEKCADDIVSMEGRTTLTSLAAKWGFSDLSHLNRAFRQHLGVAPRAVGPLIASGVRVTR
ncbi:AraC-type DNA-binding protein [Leifsonia sp. 98AMF]|uniref:AraC-like ligand-binding domain-containing protein n=1 Tax=unclassified Leifsonia TaxID=2663824 RepID=UPI00087CACB5|nr:MULTISPECIES: helix-turn-helix domain-containing protein [unclassified Leifsonia]SDH06791.1 AraC-type DNA-binding protein [Leifsonia sp. 197AMF]SDJ33502.1 AraC-type DNA-binding protein [Leifsonia sp. 466MF]SDK46427.1 AraC-type DNA-binding protein [Leifsonia sp. 157MF]SDN54406.1 AraC-type DNA-binding protein [Leifsonia sp. 509MF]SEN55578.1 AraC-type DNA-binding protein [Leifsonia sp. 467MF]